MEFDQPTEMRAIRYSPVRFDKFILLSVLSYGLYPLLWFYRNWRQIKKEEGSNLWPWARTLFAPLWYYPLLKRLEVRSAVGLAAVFWLSGLLWRLPDPYWLVSVLYFLPLLPALQVINRMNSGETGNYPSYGWRKRSTAGLVLGLLFVPLVMLGTLGPPTSVVTGAAMRASDMQYLVEAGLLEGNEEVLYFYSTGLFSSRGEGAFASNLGVTSYWTDPITEELMVAFLRYGEIVEIETNYSSHALEDTVVRIVGDEDSWFTFFLSSEDGGDRRFMDEVEKLRLAAPAGENLDSI